VITMRRFISIKTVSVITFLFLVAEWIMLMSGKGSICPSTSCQVAAESTRFGNHTLVGLGALYFLVLSLLSFWQKSDGSALAPPALMICLLSGLAFDGAILGFQFFNLSGKCPICWSVAFALIAITVIHSIQKRSVVVLMSGCLVWLCAFMANAAVIGHSPAPTLQETALWEYSSANSSEYPRYHLFFGIRCTHCTTAIKALNDHPISGHWAIAFVDRDSESLKRLSAIYSRIPKGPSIFGDLLAAKDDTLITQKTVSPEISSATQKARRYFVNNGLKGVPVMIIQSDANHRLILSGDDAVLRYLTDNSKQP